jgi:hypothetical protein
LADFNGRNIETANHGVIRTWREVEYPVPVFGAEGTGPYGELHRGFAETAQKAIVDLLKEFEIARLEATEDEPAASGQFWMDDIPVSSDGYLGPDSDDVELPRPTATGVAEALGFIQRQYAGTAAYPYTDTKDLPAEFWIELRPGGNKIRAIKHLRDSSRLSLRSCKEIVEAIQERNAHA